MTGLGRTLWAAVAAAALGGVLLSLVALGRTTPTASGVSEVLGGSSVALAEGAALDVVPGIVVVPRGRSPVVGRAAAALRDVRTERERGPEAVRLPDLGLELAVRPAGVTADGQMALPEDPAVLGWYRFGPAPGQPGSAVMAGHVDTREQGIGPLAALAAARPGTAVVLTMPSGRRVRYVVDSVEAFGRRALPDEVFSRSGPPRLRLVTCTGEFDPARGGYQQNLVVTAVPDPAGR